MPSITLKTPPTPDDIRAEPCVHCEAPPGAPCINFGAPDEPMPAAFEFHTQRTHVALAKRLRAELDALLAEPTPMERCRSWWTGPVAQAVFAESLATRREALSEYRKARRTGLDPHEALFAALFNLNLLVRDRIGLAIPGEETP